MNKSLEQPIKPSSATQHIAYSVEPKPSLLSAGPSKGVLPKRGQVALEFLGSRARDLSAGLGKGWVLERETRGLVWAKAPFLNDEVVL